MSHQNGSGRPLRALSGPELAQKWPQWIIEISTIPGSTPPGPQPGFPAPEVMLGFRFIRLLPGQQPGPESHYQMLSCGPDVAVGDVAAELATMDADWQREYERLREEGQLP